MSNTLRNLSLLGNRQGKEPLGTMFMTPNSPPTLNCDIYRRLSEIHDAMDLAICEIEGMLNKSREKAEDESAEEARQGLQKVLFKDVPAEVLPDILEHFKDKRDSFPEGVFDVSCIPDDISPAVVSSLMPYISKFPEEQINDVISLFITVDPNCTISNARWFLRCLTSSRMPVVKLMFDADSDEAARVFTSFYGSIPNEIQEDVWDLLFEKAPQVTVDNLWLIFKDIRASRSFFSSDCMDLVLNKAFEFAGKSMADAFVKNFEQLTSKFQNKIMEVALDRSPVALVRSFALSSLNMEKFLYLIPNNKQQEIIDIFVTDILCSLKENVIEQVLNVFPELMVNTLVNNFIKLPIQVQMRVLPLIIKSSEVKNVVARLVSNLVSLNEEVQRSVLHLILMIAPNQAIPELISVFETLSDEMKKTIISLMYELAPREVVNYLANNNTPIIEKFKQIMSSAKPASLENIFNILTYHFDNLTPEHIRFLLMTALQLDEELAMQILTNDYSPRLKFMNPLVQKEVVNLMILFCPDVGPYLLLNCLEYLDAEQRSAVVNMALREDPSKTAELILSNEVIGFIPVDLQDKVIDSLLGMLDTDNDMAFKIASDPTFNLLDKKVIEKVFSLILEKDIEKGILLIIPALNKRTLSYEFKMSFFESVFEQESDHIVSECLSLLDIYYIPEEYLVRVFRVGLQNDMQNVVIEGVRNYFGQWSDRVQDQIIDLICELAPSFSPKFVRMIQTNVLRDASEIKKKIANWALEINPNEAAFLLLKHSEHLPMAYWAEIRSSVLDIIEKVEREELVQAEEPDDSEGNSGGSVCWFRNRGKFYQTMGLYFDADVWVEAGFHYVPMQPILGFDLDASLPSVSVVKPGVSVERYLGMKSTTTEHREHVLRQRNCINNAYRQAGLRIPSSFFVFHERCEDGGIDWGHPPRVYCKF